MIKNKRISPVFWLLLLFLITFGINLFMPRDLWVQDEARYGEVAREMLAGGQWLVPHLNNYPYPDKPPLYFILVIALGKIVGQGELAFRLLTVLATALTASGVFLLGKRLFDQQTGFWAAALFLTCFLTLLVGQIARMDMLLAATVVFAWLALRYFEEQKKPWFLTIFWGFAAVGAAIKGPIALLFTIIPAIVWFSWEKGWSGCKQLRCGRGLFSLVILAAIWLSLVFQQGYGDYLYDIWHKQLVGRAGNSWSQQQPFYFYLALLPFLLMPWTILIFQGFYRLAQEKISLWREISSFTVLPFIGLSLISGKLFIYLQPLLPGLCIVGAWQAKQLIHASKLSAWISFPPWLFIGLLAITVGWVAEQYLSLATWQKGTGTALLSGLLLVGAWAMRQNGQRWFLTWTGITAGVSILVFNIDGYLINPLFSAKALGQTVAKHAPPPAPAAVVNTTRGILNYYANRTLAELPLEQTANWLRQYENGLLIIKTEDLPHLTANPAQTLNCRVQETYAIELKQYHVLAECRF